MKTTTRIILGGSILINILLILFLWKGPKIINFGVDEKVYRDSIETLRDERLKLDYHIDSLNRVNDSLNSLKQTIIIKSREKVRFIYSASPHQLDSIIQSLSGIK